MWITNCEESWVMVGKLKISQFSLLWVINSSDDYFHFYSHLGRLHILSCIRSRMSNKYKRGKWNCNWMEAFKVLRTFWALLWGFSLVRCSMFNTLFICCVHKSNGYWENILWKFKDLLFPARERLETFDWKFWKSCELWK